MPSSRPASPRSLHLSQTHVRKREIDDYTFTAREAREWLGCSEEDWAELVRRSKLNASRGRPGPLVPAEGGQSYTLRSVFVCRRQLTATHH